MCPVSSLRNPTIAASDWAVPPRERNQDSLHAIGQDAHRRRALHTPPFCCQTPVPLSPHGAPAYLSPGHVLRCTRPGRDEARWAVLWAPDLPPTRAPAARVGEMPRLFQPDTAKTRGCSEHLLHCILQDLCSGLFGEEQQLEGEPSKPLMWDEKEQLHEDVALPSTCGPVWLDTLSSGRIPGAQENLLIQERP